MDEDEFSFSNDIAPMQGNFVSGVLNSRNMSTQNKTRFLTQAADQRLNAAKEYAKVAEMKDVSRIREAQYQSSLLQIEEQRRKAEMEKQGMQGSNDLVAQKLQEIINEPDRDARLMKVSEFGVQNAAAIRYNPVVKQAFNSAMMSVNTASNNRGGTTLGELSEKGILPSQLNLTPEQQMNPNTVVPPEQVAKAVSGRLKTEAEQRASAAKDKATMRFEEEKRAAAQREYLANVESLTKLGSTDNPFPVLDRLVNRLGGDEEKAKAAELAKKYKDAREKQTGIADVFTEARDFGLSINEKANPYAQRDPKEDEAIKKQTGTKNLFN
jgi:hypothetical protein